MAVAAGSRKPASMRACARVALVLMAVSASFGLAACGAIDDPRDAVSRWFDVGKPPGGPGGFFADHLPNATPIIPPRKSLKNEASKASKTSKKKDKPASKVQRPQTAEQKLPTPTLSRRQSRKAPSRNPCRLSLRRRDCAPSGLNHRQPVFFHAEIGHRSTDLRGER
jgi:hypothetical protein